MFTSSFPKNNFILHLAETIYNSGFHKQQNYEICKKNLAYLESCRVNCVIWDDHVKVLSIDISKYLIVSTRLRTVSFKFKLKLALTDLREYFLL